MSSERVDAMPSADECDAATLKPWRFKVRNFVKSEAILVKNEFPELTSEEIWKVLQRRVRVLFPKFDLDYKIWDEVIESFSGIWNPSFCNCVFVNLEMEAFRGQIF